MTALHSTHCVMTLAQFSHATMCRQGRKSTAAGLSVHTMQSPTEVRSSMNSLHSRHFLTLGEHPSQTVMWPHIHLIPRRKGDMEDPRGGVRHVIPDKGNYQKPNIEVVKIGEFLTGGE